VPRRLRRDRAGVLGDGGGAGGGAGGGENAAALDDTNEFGRPADLADFV